MLPLDLITKGLSMVEDYGPRILTMEYRVYETSTLIQFLGLYSSKRT